MGSIAFDTLSTSENLQKAGIATEQAKAITLAIASVQRDLATRDDLKAVEQRLTDKIDGVESDLNSKIGALDSKIDEVEQKLTDKIEGVEQKLTDKIEGVEQKLTDKIDGVERNLNSKIDGVRSEMRWVRWVLGGIFALNTIILAAVMGPMIALMFGGT